MEKIKEYLQDAMLYVIDMQNVYSNGAKWECKNFSKAMGNISELLKRGRSENVVLTRYIASENPIGVWKDYNTENADVNNDPWCNELAADLQKYVGRYPCLDKSTYSAYKITELKAMTETMSCVITVGVVAECCVLSTVMDLIDAGKYVIYLKDAVAGIDDSTEQATLKVLEGLCPLHLSIMTTEELLEIIEGDK